MAVKGVKETGVEKPEWWKHLRPYNKRRFWKKVRAKEKRENG